MRCLVAKCLAAVTGVAILVLAVLFGYLQNRVSATNAFMPDGSKDATTRAVAPAPDAGSAEPEPADRPDPHGTPDPGAIPVQTGVQPAAILARGREVYRREGCRACHSIDGEGNRRSPLNGVGARLDRETIRRWIVEPKSMNPRVRKPAYDALSEEDLAALIAYLEHLRE